MDRRLNSRLVPFVALAFVATACGRECKEITCAEGVRVEAALPGGPVDAIFEATACTDAGCSTTTHGGAGEPIQLLFSATAPVGAHRPGDDVEITFEVVRLPERTVVVHTSGRAALHRVASGGCDNRVCTVGTLRYDGTTLIDTFPSATQIG